MPLKVSSFISNLINFDGYFQTLIRKLLLLAFYLGISCISTSCGQTGELYLPTNQTDEATHNGSL